MPEVDVEREANLAAIFEQMQIASRRGTARARRVNESLSVVEQSLVSYIGANPSCLASDIAAAFQLNRSTTSRQVNSLVELGLVKRLTDESAQRGYRLALTEQGDILLERSRQAHLGALGERLDSWTSAEVARFAKALERYNDSTEAS